MTTITREQLAQIARDNTGPAEIVPDLDWLATVFTAAGIIIAEPEPPAAMVTLAREIVQNVPSITGGYVDMQNAAAAALKHAAKVVRECEAEQAGHYAGLREGVIVARVTATILHKLGAK